MAMATISDDGRESAGSLDGIRAEILQLLERLTAAIEHEYVQERERVMHTPDEHRAELVQRLLSEEGPFEAADMAELDYDVHSSWHLGLVATGAGADQFIRRLGARYGRSLLVVSVDGNVWAWLGARTRPAAADIERLSMNAEVRTPLAVGEPGRGIDGWRLTHEQAQDALRIALRRSERFAYYADDRVLAATLPNDTLVRSLKQAYLAPLGSRQDGGVTLRQTLRAYIDLECNATAAAHALKVGRQAIKGRVCTVERLIGRPLNECLGEMDVALRLEDLEGGVFTNDASPDGDRLSP